MRDITESCQTILETFNWGNNYEKLWKISEEWQIHLNNLIKFSDTRFANSKQFSFKSILMHIGPILTCLDEFISKAVQNRSGAEASDSKVGSGQ